MKYIKLFESYKSQQELEELTKDILERIAINSYDKLGHDKQKMNYFSEVKMDEFNYQNFNTLKQFMQDYDNILFSILTNSDVEGYNFSNEGVYLTGWY